jgi:hypothetical protein
MPVAYNPDTNQAVSLQGGEWKPTKLAKNPQGDAVALDGDKWVPVGGKQAASPGSQQSNFLVPAIRQDGKVTAGKPGMKHEDILAGAPEETRGFVDPQGKWYDRKQAEQLASQYGIKATTKPDGLHSEDLNRPMAPINGQPTYEQPQKLQAKPSGFFNDILTQGGRFSPGTAKNMLIGDVQTALEAGGGLASAETRAGEGISKGAASAAKGIAEAPGAAAKGLIGGEARAGAMGANAAGYVLPPKSALESPGVLSSGLEALSGKVKLNQFASEKNQAVTNALAAKTIGLPAGEQITEQALEAVRRDAGKAYDAVRKIIPPMKVDPVYDREIRSLWQENPVLQKDLEKYVEKGELSPDKAMQWIKNLRFESKANLKARDNPEKLALGEAQYSAADSIEGLVERNITQAPQRLSENLKALRQEQKTLIKEVQREKNVLSRAYAEAKPFGIESAQRTEAIAANAQKSEARARQAERRLSEISRELESTLEKSRKIGDLRERGKIMSDFKAARQRIAQTYDIEKALNPTTGDVAAHRIAALAAKGRPLSGPLKAIADTYNAFPKAMQAPAAFGHPENWSILDSVVAGGGIMSGHPGALAGVLARPLARSTLLSKPYQNRMIGGQ